MTPGTEYMQIAFMDHIFWVSLDKAILMLLSSLDRILPFPFVLILVTVKLRGKLVKQDLGKSDEFKGAGWKSGETEATEKQMM